MSRPEDIPQDVWDAASFHVVGGDQGLTHGAIQELIARAIMAAKAEERGYYRRALPGHIVMLAVAMADALGTTRNTISNRIFGESKKVQLLIGGGDLTLWRYHQAMQWFADNWPEGEPWPDEAPRPSLSQDAIRKRGEG